MTINLPRLLIIELIIIATGVILYFAGGLLAQFGHLGLILAFSILLTYALLPAVNRLDSIKYIPRGIAILITYLVMLIAIAGFGAIISVPLSNQVKQLADEYPKYVEQVNRSIPQAQQELDRRHINYDLRRQSEDFVDKLEANTGNIVSRTGDILASFFGTLSTLFFILFVTAYFLHSGHRFVDRIIKIFPKKRQRMVRRIVTHYDRILSSFVRGQLLISFIVAVVVGTFTTIIGLPFSVIIGLVAGITAIIPVIGAALGMVLPIIIAAFTKPILIPVFIVFFLIFNEITDKFLHPKIVGKAVELHPLIVLFGLLIGVQVAGITGAILATPILALLKVTIVALRNSTGYSKV